MQKRPRLKQSKPFKLNAPLEDDDENVDTELEPLDQAQQQSIPAPVDTTSALFGQNYIYLWFNTTIRTYKLWIGIASIGLLILSAIVTGIYIFGLIPAIPPSFLYYGFVWYILFIFLGVLALFVSCSRNKIIFTISFFIALVALIVAVYLNVVITYQIVTCFLGQQDPSCADFYLTQFFLLGLTFFIAVATFVIFLLLAALIINLSRSYSQYPGAYTPQYY